MLAFLVFRAEDCSAAVYETGLGGRLDSTNIVCPEASIITPIELEHTEYLGSTIPAIAGEKAGIIKPGKPVFTSARAPGALETFREVSRQRGSALHVLEEEVVLSEVRVSRTGTDVVAAFRDPEVFPEPVRLHTPLVGSVQAENAALAALTARLSSFRVSPEAVLSGMARTRIPARFQVLPGEPPVILDGAHTPSSLKYLLETFADIFPGPAILIFACAQDKNHGEMARLLSRRFDRVIVTRPGTFKKSDPEAVATSVERAGMRADRVFDTAEALAVGLDRAAESGDPLLVTGSFYLCAEALLAFKGRS